jgi:hypothetical protein
MTSLALEAQLAWIPIVPLKTRSRGGAHLIVMRRLWEICGTRCRSVVLSRDKYNACPAALS